ncbi:MAG: AAA family ATPase [Azospirillum sp.]|nr:AAA family ATPase [Azospirillum sp.]
MIHRLEIENFYSVRDRQAIDLRIAKNVPDVPGRFAPLRPDSDERIPKVVALFGANASGKSNVLRALSFLSFFVRNSFELKPDAWAGFECFNAAEARQAPTRLAIWLRLPVSLEDAASRGRGDDTLPCCEYCYEVVFGKDAKMETEVVSESLKQKPNANNRWRRVFERRAGTVTGGHGFSVAGCAQYFDKMLRNNASAISTLAQIKHPAALLLQEIASELYCNILVDKWGVDDNFITGYYAKYPEVVEELNKYVKRMDLGITRIFFGEGRGTPVVLFEHSGHSQALYLSQQSHGTRSFFRLFPWLWLALQRGGLAVIDELDLSIHPLLLPEIIRWFHDPERNPHNAQLWMSCQSASLLDSLEKEEVFFCQRDAGGRTSVFGLRGVQGIRRTDNLYRKYLDGAFGALPKCG